MTKDYMARLGLNIEIQQMSKANDETLNLINAVN